MVQKSLIPNPSDAKISDALKYIDVHQLIKERAIEKAGGDIMLQNMADAAKLDIALELEKEVFAGFKYDSGKVWEKVAPREKESEDESAEEKEEQND